MHSIHRGEGFEAKPAEVRWMWCSVRKCSVRECRARWRTVDADKSDLLTYLGTLQYSISTHTGRCDA